MKGSFIGGLVLMVMVNTALFGAGTDDGTGVPRMDPRESNGKQGELNKVDAERVRSPEFWSAILNQARHNPALRKKMMRLRPKH